MAAILKNDDVRTFYGFTAREFDDWQWQLRQTATRLSSQGENLTYRGAEGRQRRHRIYEIVQQDLTANYPSILQKTLAVDQDQSEHITTAYVNRAKSNIANAARRAMPNPHEAPPDVMPFATYPTALSRSGAQADLHGVLAAHQTGLNGLQPALSSPPSANRSFHRTISVHGGRPTTGAQSHYPPSSATGIPQLKVQFCVENTVGGLEALGRGIDLDLLRDDYHEHSYEMLLAELRNLEEFTEPMHLFVEGIEGRIQTQRAWKTTVNQVRATGKILIRVYWKPAPAPVPRVDPNDANKPSRKRALQPENRQHDGDDGTGSKRTRREVGDVESSLPDPLTSLPEDNSTGASNTMTPELRNEDIGGVEPEADSAKYGPAKDSEMTDSPNEEEEHGRRTSNQSDNEVGLGDNNSNEDDENGLSANDEDNNEDDDPFNINEEDGFNDYLGTFVGRKLGESLTYKDPKTIKGAQEFFFWITPSQWMSNQPIPFDRWGLKPGFCLYPYQVVFLYIVINRNAGKIKGGILADPMGAGKTLMALASYMLKYHLVRNKLQVMFAWGDHNDERFDRIVEHLEKGHKDLDALCPSRDMLAVPCYCEPKSRKNYYRHNTRRGMTLTFTNPNVTMNFHKDALKMLSGGSIMDDPWPPRIAMHTADTGKFAYSSIGPKLTSTEIAACAISFDYAEIEKAEIAEERSGLHPPWEITYTGPLVLPRECREDPRCYESARIFIVTTDGCMKKQVWEKFQSRRRATRNVDGQMKRLISDQMPTWLVSNVWIDESHERKRSNTLRAGMLQSVQKTYMSVEEQWPTIWGASGTPDMSDPLQSTLFCIQALRNPEWDKDPHLKDLTEKNLHGWKVVINRLHKAARKCPDDAKQDGDFAKMIGWAAQARRHFLIRRGYDDKWLDGSSIINILSVLQVQVINCNPDDEERDLVKKTESALAIQRENRWKDSVTKWRQGGNKGDKPAKPGPTGVPMWRKVLAVSGTNQMVAVWDKYAKKEDTFNSTDKQIARILVEPLNRQVFAKVRDEMRVQDGAKFRELKKYIDTHVKDRKRKDGSRCKVVILVSDVATLAVWRSVLLTEYPAQVVQLVARMSKPEKAAAELEFQNDENRWIMLATQYCTKTGLNLQRANHVIVAQPSYQISEIEQAGGRAHRHGQTEQFVHLVILHNTASDVEAGMLKASEFLKFVNQDVENSTISK
ncbi:hypothetical protein NX059_012232 [Plenodomus lindquistii]|nr:hypothetical protein NX059_012232 [Plenodomus lindquistii]